MNPMATTPKTIDIWRQSISENRSLEFKEAKTQFNYMNLLKYCVAIANEGGGKLVLGIADQPPRPVVGTNAFRDPVAMEEKIFQKIRFRVDIEEVKHPDGRVLIFHIPSRPQGTAYHLEGVYLMRVGQALNSMSEDQLRRIFSEGTPDWLEIPSNTELSGQEIVELLDTQTYFELLGLPYPTEQAGVIERLINDQLIDRHKNSSYSINRIGALLLAKRLENFPDVARKATRVVVYTGKSKLETRLDQTGVKGYAVGFNGLVHFVMSQLPQKEIVEEAIRKEVKLAPEIAIRELVANALIHQDFTQSGSSMMVEIYSNRVEISNPGEPVVPIERFIDGYNSRNEGMAKIMRRLGICEEKSSGIDKVIHQVEAFQLPAPEFRTGYNRTIATIFGPKKFSQMTSSERVRACYQHCALKWVMSEHMTNQSLRMRFGLSESKSAIISQVISTTIEEKLIKPDNRNGNSRKFARYLPFWA